MIGIIMITVGYMDNKVKEVKQERKIEYRFVPRTFLEEQTYAVDLKSNFADMFEQDSYLSTAIV